MSEKLPMKAPEELAKRFTEAFRELAEFSLHNTLAKGFEIGNDGEQIALMHEELSEALRALRQGKPKDSHLPKRSAVSVELGDVIIRIMTYSAHACEDVGLAVPEKINYNATRPHKHGGKKF